MRRKRIDHGSVQVAARFWSLLCLIMLLAIGGSATTLWTVSKPFLDDFQEQSLLSKAEMSAAQLDARLALHVQLASFVAADPEVIDFVLGHSNNSDYFVDLVTSLPMHPDASWFQLNDAFGDRLARFDIPAGAPVVFDEADLQAFSERVVDHSAERRMATLVRSQQEQTFLLLGTPIENSGFVEGVVLTAYHLDLKAIFPPDQLILNTQLLDPKDHHEAPPDEVMITLDSFDLAIVLTPDHNAVASIGQRLVSQGVIAVGAVLFGAFGLFAYLGRSSIVRPHQALAAQKRELAELAAVAQRANDAVLLTDDTGHITWANPAFLQLTGYPLEEMLGKKPGGLLQGAGTDLETAELISKALARQDPVKAEILNYTKTGAPYWIALSISPLRNEAGRLFGYVGISSDISEARRQQEALRLAKRDIEFQALHDPLTGLPNRRSLDNAFAARNDWSHSVIVRIDLDHFKFVNDNMGHDAGDFVLVKVAEILLANSRDNDLAARVGGDEFVLLMEPGTTMESARGLAQRMLDEISQPMEFEGKSVRIGASFGIADSSDGLIDTGSLIVAADAALYEAKANGRNTICLYDDVMHKEVIKRRELSQALRQGIAKKEFTPYFQPQFDAKAEQIVGIETLARWHSADFGLVMPDEFFPLAEQLTVVDDVDDIIFHKAIAVMTSLKAEGVNVPKISFNVTASRVQSPKFLELAKSISKSDFKIAVEVLESVLVEQQSEFFHFGLDQLREAGISIEVDDFGSGHASVLGLLHLRPDAMKIDRLLVAPIVEDTVVRGMLQSIIDMAKHLGLEVIAEGVETWDHVHILQKMGCDVLQGHVFAKALSPEDLRVFLREHSSGQIRRATAR